MSVKAVFGSSVSTAIGFFFLVSGYFIFAKNPQGATGLAALFMAVGVGVLVAMFLFYRHWAFNKFYSYGALDMFHSHKGDGLRIDGREQAGKLSQR